MATYTEQLASVQAAIAAIEAAIAVGADVAETRLANGSGVKYSRADLPTLYARERDLRGLAAREARSGRGIASAVGLS